MLRRIVSVDSSTTFSCVHYRNIFSSISDVQHVCGWVLAATGLQHVHNNWWASYPGSMCKSHQSQMLMWSTWSGWRNMLINKLNCPNFSTCEREIALEHVNQQGPFTIRDTWGFTSTWEHLQVYLWTVGEHVYIHKSPYYMRPNLNNLACDYTDCPIWWGLAYSACSGKLVKVIPIFFTLRN